jgi:serine/threonine-protein kinase
LSVSVDPRIGSELFGYRVEALLGRGGMGVVYKAYDPRLKRHVALKLITPELAEDERFRERFLGESELEASLDHPNVVPIYDAFDAEGRLAIAMRYVEGTDLKRLLQTEQVLDPARALVICIQVAAALDAAHGRGLVHGDVKPSNVLLDENEHVYLDDFGLSRRLADPGGRAEGSLSVGTPAYAAPEQIEGGDADGRADVYSLGCLMYECLTGQPPFKRDSELAVLWAHVQEPPPKASEHNDLELPAEIDPVLAKAMAKTPGDRYSSCGEFVETAREGLGLHGPVTIRDRRALILSRRRGGRRGRGPGRCPAHPGQGRSCWETEHEADTDAEGRLPPTDRPGDEPTSGDDQGWLTPEFGRGWRRRRLGHQPGRPDSLAHRPEDRPAVHNERSGGGSDPRCRWQGGRLGLERSRQDAHPTRPAHVKIVHTFVPGGDGSRYCGPAAVGEEAVWVAESLSAAGLTRISPDDDLTARVAAPPCAFDVAVGGGAVWLIGSAVFQVGCGCGSGTPARSVTRVDPVKLKAVASIPLAFMPADIAADGQGVWVVDRRDNFLVRIDPKTNRVVGRVRVGDAPVAVATHGSSVWTANLDAGTVSRIDPRRGKVVATIKVGPRPTDIAAGEGGVWVIVHPS